MSRIENPREAIKDGSTGIFCLSITCQYGLLTFLCTLLLALIYFLKKKKLDVIAKNGTPSLPTILKNGRLV